MPQVRRALQISPRSPQRVLHHALALRAGLGCDGNRVAFNCKSAGAAQAAGAGWTRCCAYTAHTATRVASLTEGSGMALAVRTPKVLLGRLELRSLFHGCYQAPPLSPPPTQTCKVVNGNIEQTHQQEVRGLAGGRCTRERPARFRRR